MPQAIFIRVYLQFPEKYSSAVLCHADINVNDYEFFVADLIQDAVYYFNDNIFLESKSKSEFFLKPDGLDSYNIYLSKKSGLAKTDYPSKNISVVAHTE